eukprot:SAG11_NODE_181_length_13239_cov_10.587139_6_plen_99_part_00
MTTVAPMVEAVVAGLTARLAGKGPLGGTSGSHAEHEHLGSSSLLKRLCVGRRARGALAAVGRRVPRGAAGADEGRHRGRDTWAVRLLGGVNVGLTSKY